MKTQLIQNVFKMMIGVSALIASTAFFINTISPVQASENKLPTTESIPNEEVAWNYTIVGCGSGIYEVCVYSDGSFRSYRKVGP